MSGGEQMNNLTRTNIKTPSSRVNFPTSREQENNQSGRIVGVWVANGGEENCLGIARVEFPIESPIAQAIQREISEKVRPIPYRAVLPYNFDHDFTIYQNANGKIEIEDPIEIDTLLRRFPEFRNELHKRIAKAWLEQAAQGGGQ